ncbi:hypothetical protein HYT59_02430 [Candidatus Woesebacteria bacterium]|nr:hypothetical protein [Candidatus Woesebacteria bacterium]
MNKVESLIKSVREHPFRTAASAASLGALALTLKSSSDLKAKTPEDELQKPGQPALSKDPLYPLVVCKDGERMIVEGFVLTGKLNRGVNDLYVNRGGDLIDPPDDGNTFEEKINVIPVPPDFALTNEVKAVLADNRGQIKDINLVLRDTDQPCDESKKS